MRRMEWKDIQGAVRAGLRWGGIGGVAGFLIALFGSLAALIASGFIGMWCGRRATETSEGLPGVLAGLVGGAVAAPVFALGAAAGALVAARGYGSDRIAATLSEILGSEVTSGEAWQLFLISTFIAAVLQAAVLVATSAAAGAWATRK
jgi:hypothetical protein